MKKIIIGFLFSLQLAGCSSLKNQDIEANRCSTISKQCEIAKVLAPKIEIQRSIATFDSFSSQPGNDANAIVNSILQMKNFIITSINLDGFADDETSTDMNMNLAKERAQSIKQLFDIAKIDQKLFHVSAIAITPIKQNCSKTKTPKCRSYSDRVDITVEGYFKD